MVILPYNETLPLYLLPVTQKKMKSLENPSTGDLGVTRDRHQNVQKNTSKHEFDRCAPKERTY